MATLSTGINPHHVEPLVKGFDPTPSPWGKQRPVTYNITIDTVTRLRGRGLITFILSFYDDNTSR